MEKGEIGAKTRILQGLQARLQSGPKPTTRFWIEGFIATALILAAMLGVTESARLADENEMRVAQLSRCAGTVVRDLRNRTAALQGRLRSWRVDPRMQKALREHDEEAIELLEEALTRAIPDALRVRLLAPQPKFDEHEMSELSYAGWDQTVQAQRNGRVTDLEAHRVKQSDAHLAISGPVVDEDGSKVLGVIHVSLPFSLLPGLSDFDTENGSVIIEQLVGEQAVPLDTSSGRPSGEPVASVVVPGTSLRVASYLDEKSLLEGGTLLRLVVAWLVAVLAVAAVLALSARRLKNALVEDGKGLIALVEDGVNRKALRPLRSRLTEMQSVAGMLRILLGDLEAQPRPPQLENASTQKAPAAIPPPPEPKAAPPAEGQGFEEGVDLSDLANAAEAAMSTQIDGTTDLGGWVQSDAAPADIFRAYDIRGDVEHDLTSDLVHDLGLAIGTEVKESGGDTVLVGRDTRESGESLAGALVAGLRASGCDVVDLGVVPVSLVYFGACHGEKLSAVAVTASHNPPRYNGFKVVVEGEALEGDRIQALRDRILDREFSMGDGEYEASDYTNEYLEAVQQHIAVARPLKVVVDANSGTASSVAPLLYAGIGCEVIEIDCEERMGFSENEVPDPIRPGALDKLSDAVLAMQADIGLAFDAACDRLGVVDSSGKVISTDRLLMLLAADVLSRQPGSDIVFDVKSSHLLPVEILRHGGRPVMWKSGHSPLKAKLDESDALLAGGWSGHIIFKERWFGFDDPLYAGARLLEVLALDQRPTAEIFAELPEAESTPELSIPVAEGEAAHIMKGVMEYADRLVGVEVQTIDGLRAEFDQGWGLVRASNTLPALTFRFEGDDREALDKIKTLYRRLMENVAPELQLPF